MPGVDVSRPEEQRTPDSPDLQPCRLGEHRVRRDPGPDHAVAVELEPALHDRPSHASVRALEPHASSSPPCTSTPCSSSTPWKKPPTSRPKWRSSVTSSSIAIEQRAPYAAVSEAASLDADVAPPDQHHPLGALGVGAHGVRVAEGAQVVDAVEVGRALHPQAVHVRARGDQGGAELHLLLRREARHARLRVELHHARADEQLDPLLVHHSSGREERVLARFLAAGKPSSSGGRL